MTNKITVATNGKRIMLDVDTQEKADLLFWQMVKVFSGTTETKVTTEVHTEPEEKSKITTTSVNLPVAPKQEVTHDVKYYVKGFLYIKCVHCGEIKGFNIKQDTDHYFCKNCNQITEFIEPLIKLKFKCECGSDFRYMTNLSDIMFDINCLNCQNPVPVTYNAKAKEYEGIR